MPISDLFHLPAVVHFAGAVPHRRIIDLGIGMGTCGLALRQELDIGEGRVAPDSWETVIDGVEVFAGYRNPVWDYAYSDVRIADIRDAMPALAKYDVAICCDVLEHFDRDEAVELIRRMQALAPVFIATTPNVFVPQGAWMGNEAERHRSLLTAGDFPDLRVQVSAGFTSCYVTTPDGARARELELAALRLPRPRIGHFERMRLRIKYRLRRLWVRRGPAPFGEPSGTRASS